MLLGLKLPEIFLLLGGAGAARRARRSVSPATFRRGSRAMLFAVALAAVLPIAVTVIARPAMYNGIRHFVFVLPPLAVAGGLAGRMDRKLDREHGARLRRPALAALAVIFAAGVALPAIGMARLHPYEYVVLQSHRRRGARRAAALHARLLGTGLQAGGAGNCAPSSPHAARRRPPAANGRSRCAARIPPHRSRLATSSSRPGIRKAPTSR